MKFSSGFYLLALFFFQSLYDLNTSLHLSSVQALSSSSETPAGTFALAFPSVRYRPHFPIRIWNFFPIFTTMLFSRSFGPLFPVFNFKADYLEIYRIKDYEVNQPFFMRLFSIMHLSISTSDNSHPVFTFEGIEKSDFPEALRGLVEKARRDNRVYEID